MAEARATTDFAPRINTTILQSSFTLVPKSEFVAHGFQMYGPSIQFLTLDYLAGRLSRLTRSKVHKVPAKNRQHSGSVLDLGPRLAVAFNDMSDTCRAAD